MKSLSQGARQGEPAASFTETTVSVTATVPAGEAAAASQAREPATLMLWVVALCIVAVVGTHVVCAGSALAGPALRCRRSRPGSDRGRRGGWPGGGPHARHHCDRACRRGAGHGGAGGAGSDARTGFHQRLRRTRPLHGTPGGTLPNSCCPPGGVALPRWRRCPAAASIQPGERPLLDLPIDFWVQFFTGIAPADQRLGVVDPPARLAAALLHRQRRGHGDVRPCGGDL